MNYWMPAEWEPHEGTWLAWPHLVEHWPGKFEPIPLFYGQMVKILAGSEKVFICVNDQKMEDDAREVILKSGVNGSLLAHVSFYHIPTDASWSRDHGPIFVRDKKGKLVITDWVFNAWGNKWPYKLDDVVPQKVGEIFRIPVVQPGIVLEGGSIDVNGKGALLTTEQCLLNKNRNPKLTRKEIEGYLNRYLGVTKVLWLKEGIAGDDTDGHIDDIARFVSPDTVVCAYEENPKDENYAVLNRCYEDLKKMTDQDGVPLKVIKLPMPDTVIYEDQRLPASYANFYISNKIVLVPVFRCRQDEQALKVFQELFPDRKVIGLDCVDLVWGLGTIHCSTQQMPRA